MYWLGIAGSTLTHEQRILAQRPTLSQPHPPQKFRSIEHAERRDFAVEYVAAGSSRAFRDEPGTSTSSRSIPRASFWVCINVVRRAARPRHEAAAKRWRPAIPLLHE